MLQVKRGDTFAFYVDMVDDQSEPLVIPVANIKCQIKDTLDKLIDTMAISATATPGKYLFEAGPTVGWPTGTLLYDIKINNGGKITSTNTEQIEVIKDVTRYE